MADYSSGGGMGGGGGGSWGDILQIYYDPNTGNYVDAQGNQYTSAQMNDQWGGEMYRGANGTTYNSQQVQLVAGPPPIQQTQQQQTTPTGSGGGTASAEAPYVPEIVTYMGQNYDLNNPSDRQAFVEKKSADIDKQLTVALKSGQLGYAAKLAEIQDSLTQYMHDWQGQGQELLSGYNQGQSARQQAYQGMGTRAYQSSMGTSGQFALNQLGEAQGERNYQKGIRENQQTQATTGLENAYNDWINSTGQTAQANKDTLSTDVANIGGFDTSKMSAPINTAADLSAYTPFVNFTSLANSPLVSNAKTISKTPTSQMTLSEWLQQNATKLTNPLQQYLQGQV